MDKEQKKRTKKALLALMTRTFRAAHKQVRSLSTNAFKVSLGMQFDRKKDGQPLDLGDFEMVLLSKKVSQDRIDEVLVMLHKGSESIGVDMRLPDRLAKLPPVRTDNMIRRYLERAEEEGLATEGMAKKLAPKEEDIPDIFTREPSGTHHAIDPRNLSPTVQIAAIVTIILAVIVLSYQHFGGGDGEEQFEQGPADGLPCEKITVDSPELICHIATESWSNVLSGDRQKQAEITIRAFSGAKQVHIRSSNSGEYPGSLFSIRVKRNPAATVYMGRVLDFTNRALVPKPLLRGP